MILGLKGFIYVDAGPLRQQNTCKIQTFLNWRSGHAIACSPRTPRLRPSGYCGLLGSIVARGASPGCLP